MAQISFNLLRLTAACSVVSLLTACPTPGSAVAPGGAPAASGTPVAASGATSVSTSPTAPGTSAGANASAGAGISTGTLPGDIKLEATVAAEAAAKAAAVAATAAAIASANTAASASSGGGSSGGRSRPTPVVVDPIDPIDDTEGAPVDEPAAVDDGNALIPAVTGMYPVNNALKVQRNRSLVVTFDSAMDASTLVTEDSIATPSAFTLTADTDDSPVAGVVTYDAGTHKATFNPTGNLAAGATYNATVSTAARSTGGLSAPMAAQATWRITTGVTTIQPPVTMTAMLKSFATFATATVTNTGATRLGGHLGLNAGSSVVGFDGELGGGLLTNGGLIHVNTPDSLTARGDLTTAYLNAAGHVDAPVAVSGNLGGMTLPHGLYASNGGFAVSSGILTLDGQNDADAVWVFKMASTLVTTPGAQVVLINGAQAKNVFWQVGTQATLDTTTAFQGNILAGTSITMRNGSTLLGRALAKNGQVAFDRATITLPAD